MVARLLRVTQAPHKRCSQLSGYLHAPHFDQPLLGLAKGLRVFLVQDALEASVSVPVEVPQSAVVPMIGILPVIAVENRINAKTLDRHTQLALERWAQSQLITTEDVAEAMSAFFEKRKANFKGR